jgi:hypothetical protein
MWDLSCVQPDCRPPFRTTTPGSPEEGSPATTIRGIPGPAVACSNNSSGSTIVSSIVSRRSNAKTSHPRLPRQRVRLDPQRRSRLRRAASPHVHNHVGYFLLQAASKKGKQRVDILCCEYSQKNANGVPQVCVQPMTAASCHSVSMRNPDTASRMLPATSLSSRSPHG